MTDSKWKRDPKEHLAGGRPWQWVFESLRAAVDPASLVPSLLHFSTPTILHCCCDLPPQEVAVDVALLVQAVSEKYLPVDGAEAARMCRLACIFARSVFQRLQLEFTADSLLTLLHFFHGTITSASTVIVLGEEGRTEAGKAKVEAVAALGHFLLQVHKGALLCKDDVAGHVLFLVGLIAYPVTPVPTRSRSDPVGNTNIYEVEVQRLAFVAIGSLISQARPLVSEGTWTIAIQALRVILESLASKKTLVEDFEASRYYKDLLRCVYIVVSEPEWCLKEHIGAFMKVLRMFFRYGLSISEGKTSCSSTWQDEKDSKSTLEFDREEEAEVQINGENALMSEKAELLSTFSFDNDENASDIPVEDAFRDRSSELRLYSISILEAMARGDPEGVKKLSATLLADNIVQPGSEEATLLTVLLSDPMPKVRAAAAATLAVLLGAIKLNPAERKGRGPSGSQRQMFVELQTGLVYVIRNEKHNGTLLAALKALSLSIVTAPVSQLSAERLSDVVLSIRKRLQESSSFLDQSVKIAAIACLKAAMRIGPLSTQLEIILSREAYTESSSLTQPRSLLLELISYAQQPASTNIQVEAILALKAAAHNYPRVVSTYWDEMFKLVAWIINLSLETRTGASDHDAHYLSASSVKSASSSGFVRSSSLSVDELVHTAIELLDELLRSASGSQVPKEALDDRLLKSALPSQLLVAPEAPKLPCVPNLTQHNDATASNIVTMEQSKEDGCLQWLLALELLLPGLLEHSSPTVRGAALSCFAGLTSTVFCSLPAAKQEYILSAITRASQYDETPAVRSAACRAVGVIVGFPQVSKRIKRSDFY